MEGGWNTHKTLVEAWVAIATLSSGLYLLGYLSLRFHLTAFGIETELAVLDERYLFAGARFLVYLVTLVPIMALLLLLAAAVFWVPYRFLPNAARERLATLFANLWETYWARRPGRLALAGVVISVLLIQLVMRKCFVLSNLLLRESLPGPQWLQAILLSSNDGLGTLYFSSLVAGIGLSAGLLFLAARSEDQTNRSRLMVGLLAFLVAVQFVLLPINHGTLIAAKTVPRISSLGKSKLLPGDNRQMWLVWQGREFFVFLVDRGTSPQEKRSLVTLPRKGIAKIEIIQFDPILRVLFRASSGELRSTFGERLPRQAALRCTSKFLPASKGNCIRLVGSEV